VTSRAKNVDSLKAKLYARQTEKNFVYRSREEIIEDITDLSGVRIALYWPNDQEKVDRLLKDIMHIEKIKDINDQVQYKNQPGDQQRKRRFEWYSAKHYIVSVDPGNVKFGLKTKLVEIQVVSVLRNALAEVEHNLVYKPLSGPVSREEHNIIDALSGVVHMAECFLAQLWDSQVEKSTASTGPFTNIYALGLCLSGLVEENYGQKVADLGSLRPLMQLLEKNSLDTPFQLGKLLGQAKDKRDEFEKAYEGMRPSMSVGIIDHILFDGTGEGNPTPKEKLQMIYSTFIWLDELFAPATVWQEKLLSQRCIHEAHSHLPWLGHVDTQELLEDDTKFKDDVTIKIDHIWNWLDNHPERSVQLAFRLCKRGIVRDVKTEYYLFDRAFQIVGDLLSNTA
jgi:ppGpp synthetase/RelA/SpoT-type nucleotidyltranferase